MKTLKQQLFRATWLGAVLLISVYTLILSTIIMYTENRSSEHRLAIVAPYHFDKLAKVPFTQYQVNPLLTLYAGFDILPSKIQTSLSPQWTGITTLQLDDESEFSILAYSIDHEAGKQIYYAVEDVNPVEWDDTELIFVEFGIATAGILLFLLATYLIRLQAEHLAKPLQELVHHISDHDKDDCDTDIVTRNSCLEIYQIETAVNHYRHRMKQMLHREQTFTRYVSHELRTPMMAIKGNVSVLQKRSGNNKQLNGINAALDTVNELIHTFLCLARQPEITHQSIEVDDEWVSDMTMALQKKCEANQVDLSWKLLQPCQLECEPVLLRTLIHNLLDNAINCTLGGQVDLFVSQSSIIVVDSGIGLTDKPRGYDGFGVGLQIVEDICAKYHWEFRLENNPSKGCKAIVLMNKHT
ncbi:sensor histidine kinase [Pseudoalteromonas rubra]|uniref:histidine kinase n=1 Tax=Pseudoalteromonas rubra TaxID=43658 RepID=A0A0U3IDG5_9GAMM|nr:HAMP domain-containing sensor histidine kinase [Pseudoalteromonas rubra]ALU45175.1 hypothetical protein AT705_19610 [Pseudoalteromonas rubra]